MPPYLLVACIVLIQWMLWLFALHIPTQPTACTLCRLPGRRYQVRRLADGEDYALKHIDLQVGCCRSVMLEWRLTSLRSTEPAITVNKACSAAVAADPQVLTSCRSLCRSPAPLNQLRRWIPLSTLTW